MFRLTYLTFYGTSRLDHHTAEHIHESPMVMIGPLVVFATLSVIGGFPGVPPENGWFHHFLQSVVGGAAGEDMPRSAGHDMALMGSRDCNRTAGMGARALFL